MNTEMALFYLHAIFKKKVSSTSGSCSKAGFKAVSYYWYFHGYRNTERLLWTNSFLYVLDIALLVKIASYASVLIKLNNFYLLFCLYRGPGLLPDTTNFVQVTI